MNVKIKTIASLAFALMLALAVAGCSSSGSGKGTAGDPDSGQRQVNQRRTDTGDKGDSGRSERDTSRLGGMKDRDEGDRGGSERMRTRGSGDETPSGNVVVIRKSWSKVFAAPDENARAIALVFGNDKFEVVTQQGDWVQVRYGRRQRGWVPVSAVTK